MNAALITFEIRGTSPLLQRRCGRFSLNDEPMRYDDPPDWKMTEAPWNSLDELVAIIEQGEGI